MGASELGKDSWQLIHKTRLHKACHVGALVGESPRAPRRENAYWNHFFRLPEEEGWWRRDAVMCVGFLTVGMNGFVLAALQS